jgi:hypothetical protein
MNEQRWIFPKEYSTKTCNNDFSCSGAKIRKSNLFVVACAITAGTGASRCLCGEAIPQTAGETPSMEVHHLAATHYGVFAIKLLKSFLHLISD